jgi:hypothetical protein
VVKVYSKKRYEYTSANTSKFVYAIVFTCQKVMAAEKMMEELEELIDDAYFDMKWNPMEDLGLEELKYGSSLLKRLDEQIMKCHRVDMQLSRNYYGILDTNVKAELGSQVSQLLRDLMNYKKKFMEKREELTWEDMVQHEVFQDVARKNCYNVPTSGGSPRNDGFRAIHARVAPGTGWAR